ncbi:hypothetical protein HK096_007940 [Nowakowskiella sp. JEL0078]|nr:hypothetical protein HK096_007940 [Nowakowskiella sp. JEL0078]
MSESTPVNRNVLSRTFAPFLSSIPPTTKVLIIPIASIACGKTTLGRYIKLLFSTGHIQSDDTRRSFKYAVMDSLEHNQIVYADKNNHLGMHRREISKIFKEKFVDGIVVAVDWGITREMLDEVLPIAMKRVEDRGENHQTLTPGSCDYASIIKMFVTQREPLDLESEPDSLIDYVIDLKILNTPRENLAMVANKLGWPQPSEDELTATEDLVKQIKETPNPIGNVRANGFRERGRGKEYRGRSEGYRSRGDGWRGGRNEGREDQGY